MVQVKDIINNLVQMVEHLVLVEEEVLIIVLVFLVVVLTSGTSGSGGSGGVGGTGGTWGQQGGTGGNGGNGHSGKPLDLVEWPICGGCCPKKRGGCGTPCASDWWYWWRRW